MLDSLLSYYGVINRMSDIWWTRQLGPSWLKTLRQSRLESLVRYAISYSTYYRALYSNISAKNIRIEDLPVVTKSELMQSFDDWVTDNYVKRLDIDTFLANLDLIGSLYQNRFAVWKSSGSTGEPGIFLHDKDALATYDALIGNQLNSGNIFSRYLSGLSYKKGRFALVVAMEGHFASISSWQRLIDQYPWVDNRSFSIMTPLMDLTTQLNDYQPNFIASYPTMLTQLMEQKEKGILKISPQLIWSGGESLTDAAQKHIQQVFNCPVINEYGASECLSIGCSCKEGRLHLNADWVILEAVDKHYQPVGPGEISYTSLLTNLTNRIQPIIRYDLGDRIKYFSEACPCGNTLASFLVEGRKNDVLRLVSSNNSIVEVLPLTLSTMLEEIAGVYRFQIIQTGKSSLALRIENIDNHNEFTSKKACKILKNFFKSQGLDNVKVTIDRLNPIVDACSGKLKEVVCLS